MNGRVVGNELRDVPRECLAVWGVKWVRRPRRASGPTEGVETEFWAGGESDALPLLLTPTHPPESVTDTSDSSDEVNEASPNVPSPLSPQSYHGEFNFDGTDPLLPLHNLSPSRHHSAPVSPAYSMGPLRAPTLRHAPYVDLPHTSRHYSFSGPTRPVMEHANVGLGLIFPPHSEELGGESYRVAQGGTSTSPHYNHIHSEHHYSSLPNIPPMGPYDWLHSSSIHTNPSAFVGQIAPSGSPVTQAPFFPALQFNPRPDFPHDSFSSWGASHSSARNVVPQVPSSDTRTQTAHPNVITASTPSAGYSFESQSSSQDSASSAMSWASALSSSGPASSSAPYPMASTQVPPPYSRSTGHESRLLGTAVSARAPSFAHRSLPPAPAPQHFSQFMNLPSWQAGDSFADSSLQVPHGSTVVDASLLTFPTFTAEDNAIFDFDEPLVSNTDHLFRHEG
ncbi:hypothetical protein BV22DRAFT_1124255 [Leucogyrophana mollusca]|uniref:Uncharacterized protein n=1 Tax=Leucogyrophana mollusca TaxID=85980 RepID=A0ACB8C1Q8_9AGAM|nr:hypothetical protein BV22DRAFT_1124255 [Leucogyrophana mollusca]